MLVLGVREADDNCRREVKGLLGRTPEGRQRDAEGTLGGHKGSRRLLRDSSRALNLGNKRIWHLHTFLLTLLKPSCKENMSRWEC